MKKLALLVVALGGLMFGLGGCASPAYTGSENVARTLRTWDYENKQMVEELMYEAMFIPPSRSTLWNLR